MHRLPYVQLFDGWIISGNTGYQLRPTGWSHTPEYMESTDCAQWVIENKQTKQQQQQNPKTRREDTKLAGVW